LSKVAPQSDSELAPVLANAIERGAQHLDVSLDDAQIAQLVAYLALLQRWNRAYNLTAVRDPVQMVPRHLLDSLSIAPFVIGQRVLDIGSGAGLPGLVLAIARPALSVTLLDPALKRTRFLLHAVHQLGLGNVTVQRLRIEDYAPDVLFDTVTSRATIALQALIDVSPALLAQRGRLVSMLGKAPQPQEMQIPDQWALRLEPLEVPGIDAQRHAAVLQRCQ
jgi:16S rRNA (guanine527-N7)-methyltransferase